MSEKLVPGLMRLNSRGEVVRCSYDFDTKIIGFVHVRLPIAYAEPFQQSASHWTRHDLWKALTVNTEAVASMIVNNVFLITVTRSYMSIETKADKVNTQIAGANTKLLFTPKTPIGFVRTCPEVRDVNIPPYLLFMDENNRVSIGGESPRMLVDAVECSDVRLYKSLISTNRPAIYMSKSGPKFL